MELNSSREDCVPDYILPDMWIPELELTNDDKNLLLNVSGKLNSNHMEAVNKLLRKQVGKSIGGLQLTERVPVFLNDKNMWEHKTYLEPVSSPSCQIHHNHKDHWVASIYHDEKNLFIGQFRK
jgi:hypothetical protein